MNATAFYLTTPLYYVNDTPHIGHAYTTVVADVLARYQRFFGNDVVFLTGVDEHGQKVEKAAKAKGLDTQKHCDLMSDNFKSIWQDLNIDYDIFYRTTDETHKALVQKSLQQLFDKGDIYSKDYEGWYAESEEVFYTEKDLVDGKSPQGSEVKRIKEKNYFFKMASYQERLQAYVEENEDFIRPKGKRNEILGFLKKPLNDLCISRPKSRLNWGIELPFDSEYVTYVWFDALMNYALAVGALQEQDKERFNTYWSQAIHLIGKDILMTHAIYWPTMLMALDLPLPKTIFAHGWWLTGDKEKMSKSKGDVVKPLDMKDKVGTEALRYFLIRDIRLGNDAQFSADLVVSRVNTDLANNLGNLLNRTTGLVNKYFEGKLPKLLALNSDEQALNQNALELAPKFKNLIDNMAPGQAMEKIFEHLSKINQYVDAQAPWKMAKENLEQAGHVLHFSLEHIRMCAILLQAVMPQKIQSLLDRLGVDSKQRSFEHASQVDLMKAGQAIEKGEALFPRL